MQRQNGVIKRCLFSSRISNLIGFTARTKLLGHLWSIISTETTLSTRKSAKNDPSGVTLAITHTKVSFHKLINVKAFLEEATTFNELGFLN
jgi:hypothetical protein